MIEKVNPSHPDKLADRIAGAITDLAYQKSENPKVAVEVLMGHGLCHIINETSEHFSHYEISYRPKTVSLLVPKQRFCFCAGNRRNHPSPD